MNGSHITRECRRKETIIQGFVEDKVRKFGIGAKPLAKSLTSEEGIQNMSDVEFERALRGRQQKYNEKSYENYKINQRENR